MGIPSTGRGTFGLLRSWRVLSLAVRSSFRYRSDAANLFQCASSVSGYYKDFFRNSRLKLFPL